MTQENPPGADQFEERGHPPGDGAEDIPILQEAVDSVTLPGSETSPYTLDELHVQGQHTQIDSAQAAESDEDDFIHTLPLHQAILDDEQQLNISALEAIVLDGATPLALLSEAQNTAESASAPAITLTPAPAGAGPSLTQKRENPFLPQHVLDRLNMGRRNLVEEIAQSGAALDASTAILRARADRTQRPASTDTKPSLHGGQSANDKSARKKQQMLDDLVDEYLPLLASELRRRLKKMLDE